MDGLGAQVRRPVANNSVRSADIKNRTLKGADHASNSLGGKVVNEGALAKVPHAEAADSGQNSERLGGNPASAYAPAGAEAVRVIGAPGEVPFNTGWGSFGGPREEARASGRTQPARFTYTALRRSPPAARTSCLRCRRDTGPG